MDGIHIVAFAEEEDPGPKAAFVALWGKLGSLCDTTPLFCLQMATSSWRS